MIAVVVKVDDVEGDDDEMTLAAAGGSRGSDQ